MLGEDLEDIPSEDTISSFIFGRARFILPHSLASFPFPDGMAAGPLYPQSDSTFTGLDEGKLAFGKMHPLPPHLLIPEAKHHGGGGGEREREQRRYSYPIVTHTPL